MKWTGWLVALLLASLDASALWAQSAGYPPFDAYRMPRDAEIALAASAAPPGVSAHATIKVLTQTGYEVAREGDNGAVCLVFRGFTAPTYSPAQFRDLVYDPTVRAPICFTAPAARTALPYYELRTRLALEGKGPDEIGQRVEAAYARGELPRRDGVSFAYMWSAGMYLGPGIGSWHPHVMVFAPYYDNTMVGGSPFGSVYPQLSDDAGTPFAVVVIPVNDTLAIKPQPR